MPQPVSYNPGTPVSGSIQENNISYVVDGQNRNYRGGFGGLSWMSEVPAENNVIFIGNSVSLGRGPANIPLFYPAYNTSQANIVYAANTLPGSPRNFTTSASAYNWAVTNNFFINNSDNPIPRIDADGLVLYVDANQPTSYPQTGTSWYDLSGKNNNGTLTNGPTWNSNGWFQFDGVDDYVNCGNPSISAGKITVSALVNLNTFSNPGGSSHIVDSNSNSWHLAVLTNGVPYFWNGTTYHTAGTPLSTSRWYMLTGVQGTTLDIYVNGELNNSLNSNVNVTTDNIWIGAWALANRFLNGQVSNTQIYPRALSQAEIKQNYFQGNIVTSSLSYLWDANNLVSYGKSGTTVYNLTGSISGSLTNGTGYTYNNGGSWVFDGVDDYILLENSLISITPGNGNWTLSAWVKGPWSSGTFYPIVGNTSGGPVASGFAIYQNKIYYQNYDGSWQSHYGNTTLNPNTWYHLTWVNYDGGAPNLGTMKMYINGVADSSTFNSYTTNGGPVNAIGSAYNGAYSGNIASVQWNIGTAFSDQQVAQQYEVTKDKFQGQQIVTNGLVLNLDAANKDSYPGTGTTWYDLSGNGYNGTLINGTSFISNVYGGCFNFDGVDDYVDLQYAIIGGTGDFTVNQWIQADASEDGGTTFGNYLAGALQIFYGTTYMGMWLNNNSTYVTAPVPFSSNPVMITAIRSGTTTYFYQNGVLLKTGSSSANIGAANFRIGTNTSTSEQFTGRVFTTQAYNRALSATEITQNYNSQKTRFGY